MVNLVNRLQAYKNKINESKELNKALGELIGVDLYNFIQNDNILKKEFENRCKFLEDLTYNAEFNKLQDNLIAEAIKILKLVSPQQVQNAQLEWRNQLKLQIKNHADIGMGKGA